MIARKNRFHGHKSVSRVRGKRTRGEGFVVFYAPNKRDDFRMAVVVSKKIDKRAVARNRMRRRLYELVRKSQMLDGRSVDTVFVVQDAELADMDGPKLEASVHKALQKITG